MLFNFRFDQTKSRTILDLLQTNEPEMAQGWGGGEVNLDLNREDFVQATVNCYQPDGWRIDTCLHRAHEPRGFTNRPVGLHVL